MRYIILTLISLFIWSAAIAQDKVDSEVFPKPVFIAPNPPKAIKGWKMSDYEGDAVLIGNFPGKILKFEFEGTAVGVEVVSGPGSGIIEYSVDNYLWQKKDLFAPDEQVRYFTLEPELKTQKHMLQIRLTDDKNPAAKGNKCVLKSFYVNATQQKP